MEESIRIGQNLFHKYIGYVTVTKIRDGCIEADTGSRGVLPFAFYDFGKVLFFDKEHTAKSFNTYDEYISFCEDDKKIKLELEKIATQERERLRLKKIQEFEREKELEIERQRVLENEKKKLEQVKEEKPYLTSVEPIISKSSQWDQLFDLNSLMGRISTNPETLLKIKKDEEGKIKEILKRRKIEYFVHFTRIENLASIMKDGLVPVSLQQKKNIPSLHNDDQRIDSQLNCTSCSIGFPNYKLFYTFREYKFPGTKWVMIVVDPDILFSPTNIVYYCHTNAASVFPRVSSVKELCTAMAFENMYCESTITKENKLINRNDLQISDDITTDPQAEILISDIIAPEHIACIWFQSQSDIDEYVKNNGADLISKFGHQVISRFFKAREDYIFWKKEN